MRFPHSAVRIPHAAPSSSPQQMSPPAPPAWNMDGSSSNDDWEVISTSSFPFSPDESNKNENKEEVQVGFDITPAAGTPTSVPVIKPHIMPGWKDEYLSSLLGAERNNPVNQGLVEACIQLNDRIASLEAEKAHWQSTSTSNPPPPPPQRSSTTPSTTSEPPPPTQTDPDKARLRTDLAELLRQNTSLESRLHKASTERDALLASTRAQTCAAREVASERDSLRLRVRDQAEELRGKKQMLERVQDEVLALDMQLNVAEQQKARIAAENKQLIERWMRRVRQEADDMNAANERRD